MHRHACDDALMERAARGDRAAFAELVRRHRGWVVRVAARYLGSVSRAEDVAQTRCCSYTEAARGTKRAASSSRTCVASS